MNLAVKHVPDSRSFSFFLIREQELRNLLQKKDYVNAIGLAITLDQPFRVLTIFTGDL